MFIDRELSLKRGRGCRIYFMDGYETFEHFEMLSVGVAFY